jgi:hypothetical protein
VRCRQRHVHQRSLPSVVEMTRPGEEQHGSVGLFGSGHNRLDHLQVVDREGGQSPAVLRGEVQGFGAGKQHQVLLEVLFANTSCSLVAALIAGVGAVGRVFVMSFLRVG